MRMKTDFLNSIISILIIAMTIIGITPGIVSALDEQLGNDVNSDNGNSSLESTSLGSSSDVSSSTGSSSTDISSDASSDPDKTTSENSDSDKETSGNSDSDKAASENLDSDKVTSGNSDSDRATSGNSDSDKTSGSSDPEKANIESSDSKKASSESSDPEKASSGSSSSRSSGTDKSSADKSSTDKSSTDKSSTDKSSGESSSTIGSCIVSYSGICVPTILVRESSRSSGIGISSTDKACSVSSSTCKASIGSSSIVSLSKVESIGDGNYNSSSDSSDIDYNGTDNENSIYYIYYANEGIYIISSDGSYVFYPTFSGLNAIRDLYWMGDAVSEPEENIYAREHVTKNVINNYPVRFNFKENATCITHIEFEPLITFKKTTTTAEVLVSKSVFIPEIPAGRVYQYTNIFVGTKGAGLPNFLKSGLVGFKVEKAWIKNNNVKESEITLKWYYNGWMSLPTEKIGEDDNYVYFKSETPGFYFFAITEEKGDGVSKNGT